MPMPMPVPSELTFFTSITKLMGEAFKLHSQALVGYEDAALSAQSGSPEPSLNNTQQHLRVLEMQPAY
jgi:hypothetical protein